MALCLAESILETGAFDPRDQLQRYVHWYRDGHLSSTGAFFDIGISTRRALERFERTGDEWPGTDDPSGGGNGPLMRLAPVPLAFARRPDLAATLAADSARVTHGAPEAAEACLAFALLIIEALDGTAKADLLVPNRWPGAPGHPDIVHPRLAAVLNGTYISGQPPQIRGGGYIVDALEAALWAVYGADTFREAVLRAANLGDDADTTAAIAGQLAGAVWGVGGDRGVPDEWVTILALRPTIEDFADRLYDLAERGGPASMNTTGSSLMHTSAIPDAIRPRAFWVAAPRFIAGAYPGDSNATIHAAKIQALLDLHITHVISLMEPGEVGHHGDPFTPYAAPLQAAGVVLQRHAIPDVTAPSVALTKEILDTIDGDLDAGGNVYVHCWGGRGRTGTIVGCWLVRHGLIKPQAARAELARLRSGCADARIPAPDTAAQLHRITSWEVNT